MIAVHSFVPFSDGGWVGVDVFFVLSGFLITGLLLGELDATGRIGLVQFYVRRAGRLYPALIVLVVACLPWAHDLGDKWHGYGLTAALALTYTQDIYVWFWHNLGGGIGHVWSLAVEEQFYLLWPVAMIGFRGRRRPLLWVCGVGSSVSIGLLFAGSHGGRWLPTIYFAPQARAFELLAGCAIALVGRPIPFRWIRPVALGSLAALMALLVAAVPWWAGATTGWFLTAAAGVGVGLVWVIVSGATLGLTWAPLQWFGRRSYGAYLYHLPILAGLNGIGVGFWWVRFPLTLGLTAAASAASFRWVEQPIKVRAAAAVQAEEVAEAVGQGHTRKHPHDQAGGDDVSGVENGLGVISLPDLTGARRRSPVKIVSDGSSSRRPGP